jgi:hypothetical protein
MAEYEVGYKKPPADTRFRPGQSGNPKGRSKGTRNFKTDLAEELAERVTLREGGRTRTVSKQRAFVKSLVANAVQGKPVGVRNLLDALRWYLTEEETGAEPPLSADEAEVLARYAKRILDRPKAAATPSKSNAVPKVPKRGVP